MPDFDNALRNLTDGDTTTPVPFNLTGYQPYSGSGHLDPGAYEFEFTPKTAWVKKKDRAGFNLRVDAKCVTPGFEGVKIIKFVPAPYNADEKRTGERMIMDLVWATASHRGNLAAHQTGKEISYPPAWFHGKRFYATVKDGEGQYAARSEFDQVLGADEYRELTASRSGHAVVPQTHVPNIGTVPAGNGSQAPAAVAAMLGVAPDTTRAQAPEAPPF